MSNVTRREFAETASAGILAAGARNKPNAKDNGMKIEPGTKVSDRGMLAPACGLYCGVCADKISGQCHGCGCECGKCAGKWRHDHCEIHKCSKGRGLESCAACTDLPCTMLIQFAHDPVWTTHSVCIDNLKRRRKLGTSKWIDEQKNYWSDENRVKKETYHHDECARKANSLKKEESPADAE